MAGFRKDKTTAAQTSANVAGSVVTALIEKGELSKVEDVAEAVTDIFQAVFEELSPIVEADNEVFAAAEATDTAKPARSGGKRSGKTGGRKGGSGGGSSITLDDALTLTLNSGAFEGETLGFVLGLDAETADEDYDYGNGERNGRDYIAWLSSENNKNDFTRRRAQVIADAEGIDY